MKKVLEKKWDYTLYEADDKFILSVLCGTVAMYDVKICLTDLEVQLFKKDYLYIDKLAAEIRNDPNAYSER